MAGLETRRMGRTEMRPASLGLGAAWLGQRSERETIEAIHRAIDLGINYIDTYPKGQEDRWGRALEGGLRQKVYLQAKVSPPDEGGKKDFSAEATRLSVVNSLKLLKTDYLDSVLIHDPFDIEDPLAPGHALDELIKMKEEGFIRHLGLGVHQHEFHRRAIETGHIDIILTFLDYTLLDQSVAQTTLPLARERDIGIILASPMGMGTLTGEEPNREDELRHARKGDPDAKPQAHDMWKWCRTRGVNIRHLAVQFCLAAPVDGIVMFGPANKQQVEEGYEAATAHVPDDVWHDFESEFGVTALRKSR